MKHNLRLLTAAAICALAVAGCNNKDPLQTAAPPPSPGAVAEQPATGKHMPGGMTLTGGQGSSAGKVDSLPGSGK